MPTAKSFRERCMTDPDSSPNQLDQLFAAPGDAPSVPTAKLPFDKLTDAAGAQVLPSSEEARIRALQRFHGLLFALTPFVWVTPLLVLSNIIVYLILVAQGVSPWLPTPVDLIKWGANYAPLTWGGQPWRLVSSMFLHGGILHLAFNMWALWSIGRFLERLVGNWGLLLLYFVSGMTGSITSLWWNGDAVSVGASGAIFGMVGALVAFVWNRTETLPLVDIVAMRGSLVTFVGYNLLFGAAIGGVDQAAHLGGLLGGLACGFLLSQPLDQHTRHRRLTKNLLTGIVCAMAIGIMVVQHPAPPPNFFEETKAFLDLVPSSLKSFNEMVQKFEHKEISHLKLANWVEKDLLPPWTKVREHFESLTNVPSGRRDLLHQMRSDLILREEGWKLLVEALRTDNQEKVSEFQEKQKQAEQIENRLNSSE
jgi:rhomboid protease GluP